MLCELCGKDTKFLKKVVVEGLTMDVCEGCTSYGKPVTEAPTEEKPGPVQLPQRSYRERDIFENIDHVLIPDWAKAIREAREKKGMTREELGAAIGERTVTVANIENKELHPTDKMVAKLEKELDITLMEKITTPATRGRESGTGGITLGDIIKHDIE